jgi:hypothetical protein
MTFVFRSYGLQIFAVCLTSLLAAPAWSDDWEWSLTPYVWGISTEADVAVVGDTGGGDPSSETELSDLIDKFDFGFQVHLEGRKDRYGFMLDYTNLQLSDRVTRRNLEIDSDSETNLLEAAAIYALFEGNGRTELMVGIRALDVEVELEIEGLGPVGARRVISEDGSLVDAMLGVRNIRPLSDKWSLALRGDIASGDTEFSWNVSASVARRFGERSSLILGYRYLNVEFDDMGDLEDPELAIYGPEIGYMFHF